MDIPRASIDCLSQVGSPHSLKLKAASQRNFWPMAGVKRRIADLVYAECHRQFWPRACQSTLASPRLFIGLM